MLVKIENTWINSDIIGVIEGTFTDGKRRTRLAIPNQVFYFNIPADDVVAIVNQSKVDPTSVAIQQLNARVLDLEQQNVDLQTRLDTVLNKYKTVLDQNALQLAELRALDEKQMPAQIEPKRRLFGLLPART